MTTSTSIYVDIVFVPIYAVLLVLLAFNLYNHRHNGFAAFGFAIAFTLSRVVGNILLVVANYIKSTPSTVQNLYIAGVIIQSIGFGEFSLIDQIVFNVGLLLILKHVRLFTQPS